jgi:hypothetical protein
MSSVTAVNNLNLSYLTQVLSNATSLLGLSGLSSSQVQSVLQDASPSDIVQLSDQALQLQDVNTLFGSPDTSQTAGLFSTPTPPTSSDTLDSILTTLSAGSGSATSTASSPAAPALASQIATYQSQLQASQVQSFLGTGSGTSLNVLA